MRLNFATNDIYKYIDPQRITMGAILRPDFNKCQK